LPIRNENVISLLRFAGHHNIGRALRHHARHPGSRPNTIAQLLADSPAGQLGWIVEKYHEWTDQAHELPEQAIDRDKILTTVSIYWLTDTALVLRQLTDIPTAGESIKESGGRYMRCA